MQESVGMSPLTVALVAGLTGAVIAALFNYGVRFAMFRQQEKAERQRLAFLYILPAAELSGYRMLFEVVADLAGESFEKLRDALRSQEGEYEASHRICALVSHGLQSMSPEDSLALRAQGDRVVESLDVILKDLERYEIPPEHMSKLPRRAIVKCRQFIEEYQMLRMVIKPWRDFFQTGRTVQLDVETIFSHWEAIERITDTAEVVCGLLMKHGGLVPSEIAHIASEYANRLRKQLAGTERTRASIRKALEHVIATSMKKEGMNTSEPATSSPTAQ